MAEKARRTISGEAREEAVKSGQDENHDEAEEATDDEKNIVAETKLKTEADQAVIITEVLGVTINSIQTKITIFRQFNSIEEISPVNLNRIWGRKLGVTICSIIS